MNKTALAKLNALRADMTKTYGNAVTRNDNITRKYECVSTGSISLDVATVVGGLPLGRIAVYWGQEGQGKTTACIAAMVAAQKQFPDRIPGYIDMEQTFDFGWAESHGLKTDEENFLHVYPDNSEDVADQIKKMLLTGLFSIIIVDSIGGMESQKAFDKDAEQSNMGKNAQIITRMSKQVAVEARKNRTAIVFVSQVRADFASHAGFDTFAGPKSIRHSNSMVIKFSRTATPMLKVKVGGDDVTVGKEFKAKVERSKVGTEGRTGTFMVITQQTEKYGPIRIDSTDEMVSVVDLLGLIPKNGSRYLMDDDTKINGRDALKEHFRKTPADVVKYRQLAIDAMSAEVVAEEETEFKPAFAKGLLANSDIATVFEETEEAVSA